ncbi:hypothetical protein Q9L58_006570 [Maublancomyces gigas]|uniref:Ankyrin n=1 Tax=Discina gigas TaxID=1032678 RepID=A0ABR3GG10_9PEZI
MSSLLDAVAEQDYDKAELLLDGGADVNAELEGYWATVLDCAAWSGDYKMVKLLINHGVNLDTPVRSRTGMTVFQNVVYYEYEELVRLMIDAGADNMVLVELLLDSRADVNAPGSETGGFTALQEAARSWNMALVKFLVERGADINAPAVEQLGRTALQAAAENGDALLVEFLINAKANVNAPAAGHNGRTALQAAAGEGHEEVLKLLLSKGALPNAPPGEINGKTALRAAIDWEGHFADVNTVDEKRNHRLKMVKLLLGGGAVGHETKDSEGRNILHAVCLADTEEFDPRILEILLPISTPRALNAKDFSGSTPLHCAVRQVNLVAVTYLIQKNANLEIKDNSGRTVLQVAFPNTGDVPLVPVADTNANADADLDPPEALVARLAKGYSDITKLLLKNGARTDGLSLEDLPILWRLVGNEEENIVILRDDMTKGTNVANGLKSVAELNTPFDSPSIHFCSSTSPTPMTAGGPSFAHPASFVETYKLPSSGSLGVHWSWSFVGKSALRLTDGFPDPQDIVSREVVLVGYVFFSCPVEQQSNNCGDSQQFILTSKKVEMSWIMKQEKGASFLRSVQYRRSLQMKHLIIPQNVVHFITLFLGDLRQRWITAIDNAKEYLVQRRDNQLSNAGKKPETITGLLKDSQQWSTLRKDWQKTLNSATELLAQLKEQDIFFPDVKNTWEFRKDHRAKAEAEKMKLREQTERRAPITRKLEAAGPTVDTLDGLERKTLSIKEHGTKEEKATNESRAEDSKGENIEHRGVGSSKLPDPIEEPKPAPKSVSTPQGASGEPIAGESKAGESKAGESKAEDSKAGGPTTKTAKAPIIKPKTAPIEQQNEEGPKVAGPKAAKVLDDLEAMKKLSKLFRIMQRECEAGITELEKETTEMIGLFNLISIFEARRSIEASVSMKRLSWITFIFLPLMFISGMFGMNVNILQGTPPAWQWYFVVAVPFSTLVILVWILCKYLPGIKSLERRLDGFLKSLFSSRDDVESDSREVKPASPNLPVKPVQTLPYPTHSIPRRRTILADEEKRTGG